MPYKPKKPCTYPGCSKLTTGGPCSEHKRKINRQYDKKRDEEQPWRAWIHSTRWRKASDMHKAEHPLCAECERQGRITPVYVTHHIIPHEGDYELFWDESNWESSCQMHHEEIHKGERFRR